MIAVDTNVVVRFMVADHPEQTEKARALFASQEVLVSASVLLETEWVLRNAYGLKRDAVASAFSLLARLSNVQFDHPRLLERAIAAHRAGVDFADALHVLSAEIGGAEKLATFDKDFVKRAGRVATVTQIIAL